MRKAEKVVWIIVNVFVFAILMCSCGRKEQSPCRIVDLAVNGRVDPMGIDENPVFSWRMEDETPGQKQHAYQLVVGESPEAVRRGKYIWDSGKVESDISVGIPYEGSALQPEQAYYWQVSVWDKDDLVAKSEDYAVFETGVLQDDWGGAQWIGSVEQRSAEEAVNIDDNVYTIEYSVIPGRTVTGFVWGADTNYYGDYFRWDFDTLGDSIEMVAAELHNDAPIKETRISLSEEFSEAFGDIESFCNELHHVRLEVAGRRVQTYVDGIPVLEVTIEQSKAIGNIGLWTTRGAYYAYYDDICVTDAKGALLYCENFENVDHTIFSPYYIKLVDGKCEASSGYLMTPGGEEPAPMLRRAFHVQSDQEIESARLYATALGIYDIYVDETRVCNEYMAPGQSAYSKEVYYQTYDITEAVKAKAEEGREHVIGVLLGHGRYNRAKSDWGEHIAFCAKIVIHYADGSSQTIVTDDTWRAYTDGPIRNDDMFAGEFYDSNYEVNGWLRAEFAEDEWEQARILDEYNDIRKIATVSEPVRCIDELEPVSVSEPRPGVYVYDFGQNFNGNCKITLKNTAGSAGQVLTIRYAEALNEEEMSCRDDAVGTIWTENLYTADNTDYYVMCGRGEEAYTPTFVCRGFRYVQISGYSGGIPTEDIRGLVIASDNKRTGYFTCSDEQVNHLYNSIYWTQLSNYVDIPTDCPQRDERFGWTGDAQVFAHTADYNADVYGFFNKYLRMFRTGQCDNGAFPEILPSVNSYSEANGWSDAGIILVWELYQQYGNTEIIRENLDAMCRYMDYLVEQSDNFIRSKKGYSDHNAVSILDDDIANTAQCAYVALLLSKMCMVIEEAELAEQYSFIYNQYKMAWQEAYINENGSIDCWLQSAYTLGLAFDLYPEELKAQGAECLNTAVAAGDYHLNTGYIATPFLLPVLCEYGYSDAAYRILLQETAPSWNSMLARGGTTIAEAWYTYYETEGGTYAINGSLNHPGLGSVGEWFYSGMLGIKRDEAFPAYKHFYLEPIIGGGLAYASGSFDSMYGTITSGWRVEGEEVIFTFTIPANTSATVSLPDAQYRNMELEAGSYEYRIKCAN